MARFVSIAGSILGADHDFGDRAIVAQRGKERLVGERLVGTALGCVFGAIIANYFGPKTTHSSAQASSFWACFGAVTKSDRAAYRFAGMTLADCA